jgi:hypothetical protein
MNVITTFAVLEDGEPIATFDSYSLAVAHIDKHAVKGRKYQIVRELVTEEKELPTIADTGWKEEYFGMWADVDGYDNPQLILGVVASNDILISDGILVSDFTNPRVLHADPEDVRLRYDLAPVNLTPRPIALKTLEDYEGAPAHTVITCSWEGTCPDLVKNSIGEWVSVGEYFFDSSTNLAGERRKVLYWPEEEE